MDDLEPQKMSDTLKQLIGEDLGPLSIDELSERIEVLSHEIERIKQVLDNKKGSHADAEALFKM